MSTEKAIKPSTAAKREIILNSALEVFADSSFQEAKISDIASEAGISVGSIYDYYRDKEDLFFSVADRFLKQFMEQVDLHLAAINGAINQLRKFIWIWLYFTDEHPRQSKLIYLEQRKMKSFIECDGYEYLKLGVAKLLDIIENGQKEGTIRPEIDKYLARQLILGIIENIITRWLLKDCSYTLVDRSEEIVYLLISGLQNTTK